MYQSEEALHSRVITSRADAAHRPDKTVAGQSTGEFLRPELAAAIAMRHAPGHVTTPAGHSQLKSVYGQARLHSGPDRVADDPGGVDVLDRAHVQFAPHRPSVR